MRIEVNTINAAKASVLVGLGIWQLPRSVNEQEVIQGELVRILPDWNFPTLGICAVWPDIGPQKALSRRLIDHFIAHRSDLML